jgi:nucleoside-diphosphate kinase
MILERTLILVKPDAIQRNLLGEIITRFERKGLKIVGLKMIQLGADCMYFFSSEKKDFSL